MQSLSRIATACAALSMAVLVPGAMQAQARPAAADVITKYVNAIGGKDAIMKITSMSQTATMELPSMGISATMEIFAAAPNKMASKTTIPGIGDMQNGYNGTVAWDVNPMAGPRLLADKELATMAENADFYANLLYSPDRFASMETVGDTTINGEKAWSVRLVRKSTQRESFAYFSATSGLLLGSVSTTESQMGAITSSQTISGYKKFGNVMMPTKVEASMGPQKMVMTTKDVTFNATPDSVFAVPAQVKPLIKP